MIVKLVKGSFVIFAGQKKVATSRKLKNLAILPFCLSIFFLLLGFVGVVLLSPWLATQMFTFFPERSGLGSIVVFYFLMVLIYLLAISTYSIILYILFTLFSGPIFSKLARTAMILADEHILSYEKELPLKEVIKSSLKKAFLFLCLSLPLLIMAFIPILNFVVIWLSLCVLSYDSLDYSLEHLNLDFAQKRIMAKAFRYEIIGSGFVMALLSVIPGVVFLLLPGLTVGYADVFARNFKNYKQILDRAS